MISLKGGGRAFVLRRELLKLIAAAGEHGLTCDEIESETDLAHQSVSPRIWELVHAGALEVAGERRPTRLGNPAKAWRATGRPIGTIPKRAARRRYELLVDDEHGVSAVISLPAETDVSRVRALAQDHGYTLRDIEITSARSEDDAVALVANIADASRRHDKH